MERSVHFKRIGLLSVALGAALMIMAARADKLLAQTGSILQQVVERGTLRVAVIGGNPPYSVIKPDGTYEGYDIEIAKRLAAAMKLKVEFVATDVPGRVAALQTRKADVTIAALTTSTERSMAIAITEPYLAPTMHLMVPEESPAKVVDDLNKPEATIVFTRGGIAEGVASARLPKAKVLRVVTEGDAINALLAGQADAMLDSNLTNLRAIKDRPGKLRQLGEGLARLEQGIGLPAGDSDWYRVINEWVRLFNSSGDNKRLFKQWFGYDQPPIQIAY